MTTPKRHGGNIQRLDNMEIEDIVSPDASEAFVRDSIFDKIAFCLGENQVVGK